MSRFRVTRNPIPGYRGGANNTGEMEMQVNVYEEDGVTLNCGPVDLREICGDDDEMFTEAMNELKKAGRYWLGGGSAPLYFVKRAS